ncbi:uncharacterized protein LOC125748000 isoform X5 [Brienomyrus brachyistius]|uniref:uncharacterized protein LOC125748000 isoform X5 n=1 Tax=Brienomyrus brachyistius TaxID=42636 RepID=UPI0020B396D8|nr:uncharacterized protein LOC125748000 isoform X5 [Brienomyrus brachyistius]
MTVLQNLNAYLTERLMVAAGEILEVVAKTILEYQEETARTVKENEELRRRLREVGGQNNLMSDGAQRVAPPVSVGAAAQSQQPHEPQCNSGLEEDREPPQTDIKQEFLEQHESKPEQGAVDLNKQASALACAENPSEHRILQPSLPFEEKTEEVGCLPHMLPDQIKSELDELDYSPQELPIFSQPLNRINNGSNTAESENLVDMNWMESGGVMPELNEQDSGREVCDIPVVGGLQHVPCTSLKGQTTEDKTNASKASQCFLSGKYVLQNDEEPERKKRRMMSLRRLTLAKTPDCYGESGSITNISAVATISTEISSWPHPSTSSDSTNQWVQEIPKLFENLERRVLLKLDKMEADMKNAVESMSQAATHSSTSTRSDITELLEEPCKTVEELEHLCSQLKDVEFRNNMMAYLCLQGGSSLGDGVRRMLKKIGDNSLWALYSYKGRKGKRAFQQLPINDVIIRSCNKVYPQQTCQSVEDIIGVTLKHAPDREKTHYPTPGARGSDSLGGIKLQEIGKEHGSFT